MLIPCKFLKISYKLVKVHRKNNKSNQQDMVNEKIPISFRKSSLLLKYTPPIGVPI